MQTYIENIINIEQLKLLDSIVTKYGTKGNFTKDELINRFLKNRITIETNDKFKVTKRPGRPKKET